MTLSAAARVLFAALLPVQVLWGATASAAEPAVASSAAVTVQPPEPSEPAEPAPAGQAALPAAAADKAGRFMANLKLGPAFLAYPTFSSGVTLVQAALIAELGFAVTPDRNGYLLFPLAFQLSPGSSLITIPVGFQYDVRLPVRGLYLTPRGIVGYTAAIASGSFCSSTNPGSCTSSTFVSHLGVVIPEIGVKYIIKGRFNVGFDPFSLPIYFGGNNGCNANGTVCTKSAAAVVFYRLLFYGGVNF